MLCETISHRNKKKEDGNKFDYYISVGPASSSDTQPSNPIPLVTFDEAVPIGLLWLDWKEDGYRADRLIVVGPVLCNDLMIGEPPKGMITVCVPY